jgi:hypothetical protein
MKQVNVTSGWTFGKRIDTLIQLMSSYKGRCDKLMKGGELPMYVLKSTLEQDPFIDNA